MKLTQEPCPNCHHIMEKENATCPTCGCTKKPPLGQAGSLRVATIERSMTIPPVCDGSCLANHRLGDEIKCEDGEVLVFYLCIHDHTWFLVTLAHPVSD